MQNILQTLLAIHITAGSISLILFWVPAFTRKGNKLHRKTGIWYTYMMWTVVITAAILSIHNALAGKTNLAIFLGFISIITANPLWYGVVILKFKKELSPGYIFIHRAVSLIIVLFGAALLVYGGFFVESGIRYLMIFFGMLASIGVIQLIRSYSSDPKDTQWMKRHYTGMISSGIAAYTAFFAFGGRVYLGKILTNEGLQLIPWIAPTLVGIIAIQWLNRKYRLKGVRN